MEEKQRKKKRNERKKRRDIRRGERESIWREMDK
jgi:hypothetical protein